MYFADRMQYLKRNSLELLAAVNMVMYFADRMQYLKRNSLQ
jgi:hypothetical protein